MTKRKPKILKLKRRDYQPSKAELEEEFDMPKAKIGQARKAFFQPVKIKTE